MRHLPFVYLSVLLSTCDSAPTKLKQCTEIGCSSAVRIEFMMEGTGPISHSGGFWPEGEYTITVGVDGVNYTCQAKLPLSCEDTNVSCTPDAPFYLIQSGCALEASEHAITGLEIYEVQANDAPKQMSVDVVLHEQSLGTGSFALEYESFSPNGEGCEPICRQAPYQQLDLRSP